MILTLHNRKTTQDVDVYPLNIPDSTRPGSALLAWNTSAKSITSSVQSGCSIQPTNGWLNPGTILPMPTWSKYARN